MPYMHHVVTREASPVQMAMTEVQWARCSCVMAHSSREAGLAAGPSKGVPLPEPVQLLPAEGCGQRC